MSKKKPAAEKAAPVAAQPAEKVEVRGAKIEPVTRWQANIVYRMKKFMNGDMMYGNVLIDFDEMEELHETIEEGFSFFTIESIEVRLNPDHMPTYRPTVEDTYRE